MCGEDVSSRCVSCGGWKNKIEGALFNKGMCPYYPCPASCPDLSLKEANDQRLKKRSRTVQRLFQHVFKLCDSAKQTQRLRGPSSVFVPQFLLYIFWLIVGFLVVCTCALVYCMILYSQGLLCLCFDFESGNKGMKRLRTSHSERGWWVQLCLETEEIHSSTEATSGLKVPR